MNKKGFTLVELLTTFLLLSVILVLLIKMTSGLSNMYDNVNIETTLYYKQSIISKNINDTFIFKPIKNIEMCDKNCIDITYIDQTNTRIRVENNLIYIGNDVIELFENSRFGDIQVDILYAPIILKYKNDSILNIKIPIFHKKFKKNYGINFVYQFNRSTLQISV